jgi:hypothetical protein
MLAVDRRRRLVLERQGKKENSGVSWPTWRFFPPITLGSRGRCKGLESVLVLARKPVYTAAEFAISRRRCG